MEVWKDVVGYENIYQVSDLGNVKALTRLKTNNKGSFISKEKILKQGIDDGYCKVVLTKNGVRRTEKVHRLVAIAFLGFKKDLCVNHIDSNRSNNNLNNLEWLSHLENIRHARRNNRYPKFKMSEKQKLILKERNAVKVICIETNIIYDSIRDASKQNGIKDSTLRHYLLGTRKNITTLRYLKN